jgi:hypothetical protein
MKSPDSPLKLGMANIGSSRTSTDTKYKLGARIDHSSIFRFFCCFLSQAFAFFHY